MKFPCVRSHGGPQARQAHRGIFLLLALSTLATGGYAASPENTPVTQTALSISTGQTGPGQVVAGRHNRGSSPRKIVCQSRAEALQLGNSFARDAGAKLLLTSGTRSMEPVIRGRVYVVAEPIPYDRIIQGDLLVYLGRPDATKPDRTSMLHRAVLRDKGGWLMSGDNNRWTESWDRVTPVTYVGTVTTILEFPQT